MMRHAAISRTHWLEVHSFASSYNLLAPLPNLLAQALSAVMLVVGDVDVYASQLGALVL
jgi:hypothetical protein